METFRNSLIIRRVIAEAVSSIGEKDASWVHQKLIRTKQIISHFFDGIQEICDDSNDHIVCDRLFLCHKFQRMFSLYIILVSASSVDSLSFYFQDSRYFIGCDHLHLIVRLIKSPGFYHEICCVQISFIPYFPSLSCGIFSNFLISLIFFCGSVTADVTSALILIIFLDACTEIHT